MFRSVVDSGGNLSICCSVRLILIVDSGRIGSFIQTMTLEHESIGPRTLADVLEATPPCWKFAGWMLHNTHYSDLVVPATNYLGVPRVNLVSQ